jgi:endoribonuclease Nob1
LDSQDSVFRWAVDAGAFYTGLVFQSSASRYCTTDTVFDEVKHIKKSQGAIEVLLESNSLQILNPDKKSIEKVFSAARRTGDYLRLSEADISIIALALQLEVPLITDDYAVANVATTMKIPVKSLATRGITHTRKWMTYCSACGRTFGATAKECRLCGNALRRKYKLI